MNYKYFFACFLLTVIFHITTLSNDSSSYKLFHLTGKIKGLNRGTVYLRYTTDDFGTSWDSCALQNGTFHFKGKVNEPTTAEISFERELPWGRNRAEIFLESGNLTIWATRDSFYALQMSGSISQKDYERLSLAKRKVFLELLDVQEELKRATSTTSKIKKDSLQHRELILYKEKGNVDSLFIIQNPTSFVTAYLIKSNMDFEQFLLYPIDDVYNQMPDAIKNSSYGRKILWHMNKVKKVPLGRMAPSFSAKAINGEVIDLQQFQGKSFLLLDFWGSWCFPCRRLTPFLRNIYEEFHTKGFEIISIAIRDQEESWKKAIAEDSMSSWQHILDNDTIKERYSADYVPVLYLIDKEGKVIARYSGGGRTYGEKPIWELYGDLSNLLRKEELINR